MKALIVFVMLFALQAFPYSARQIGSEIRSGGLPDLASKTDRALSGVISFAVFQLRERGFETDANEIEREYSEKYVGAVSLLLEPGFRDIGNHKPLSEWLATVMAVIEMDIGFQTAQMLHLTDIDVINFGIPVVFNPCNFPMDGVPNPRELEYLEHFAASPKYGPAFVPVITYWVTQLACTVGTWGAGLVTMVCSPLSMAAEYGMYRIIAPTLSVVVFNRACGS